MTDEFWKGLLCGVAGCGVVVMIEPEETIERLRLRERGILCTSL